jgi:hypothetical protein
MSKTSNKKANIFYNMFGITKRDNISLSKLHAYK